MVKSADLAITLYIESDSRDRRSINEIETKREAAVHQVIISAVGSGRWFSFVRLEPADATQRCALNCYCTVHSLHLYSTLLSSVEYKVSPTKFIE